MEEKQKQKGEKMKTKKPSVIEPEETCIVDKLMDEIRNGFPLKKRKLSRPPSPGYTLTNEKRKISRDLARKCVRRASLAARALCKIEFVRLFFRVSIGIAGIRKEVLTDS